MKASENVKVNVRYHILIYIYIFNSQQRFTENICCELNALYYYIEASLVAQTVKRLPTRRETQVQSTGWGISCRKKWQPTPVSLLGKSHGQRSLLGYSPWCCKELDTTEQLSTVQACFTEATNSPGSLFSCCSSLQPSYLVCFLPDSVSPVL